MSNEQQLLRIGLPDGVLLYASRFREMLAKAGAPPQLFHRNAAGHPEQGLAPIRVVGGRSWVGLLADSSHADVFYQSVGSAIRVASEHIGRSLPVSVETHRLDVRESPFPIRYWVREMVIKRRSAKRRNADITELSSEMVMQGLERIAMTYGLDIPPREALDFQLEVKRERGLRLITTNGPTNEYVTLVDAFFDIRVELSGIWMVGNLNSRGYGRIGRQLAGLAVNLSREQASPRRVAG